MADDQNPDLILEEAMDWLLRLQDAPRDLEVFRQFEVWLSESSAHARAWEKARRTWQLMGEIPPAYDHLWNGAAASSQLSAQLKMRLFAAPRRGRRWMFWAGGTATAAAIGIFLMTAAPSLLLRIEADYVTATAESRVIELEDGSVVTLGADSAIATDFDDSERRLVLLAGEAFFKVTHDPSRPFLVEAGDVDAQVLGTAFNMRLSTAATTIELARGSIGVSYEHDGTSDVVTLAPGEMMVVDRQTGTMVKSPIAQEDIATWRSGHLFVRDATIGAVVEQLRRYHSAWIALPDGDLASQRVTGLYDLRDPDRALRALVQAHGGEVREVSPYLRVLSRF